MSTKRVANSPPDTDSDEKRLRGASFLNDSDSDATIISPEFLSSTVIDPEAELSFDSHTAIDNAKSTMASADMKQELQSLLCEPEIIEIISKVVAAQFTETLKREIASLKDQLVAKDNEITALKDKVDDLEQYGRRNSIRVTGIPESSDEDTDAIIKAVAGAVNVNLTDDMIDRSHRVGPKPSPGDSAVRPILVKLTSYRHKKKLMVEKKRLGQADLKKALPQIRWTASTPSSATRPTVFFNDDLTRIRAEIAAIAREKKRKGTIENTWVKDGVIFVKKGTIHRVTTKRDIERF